MNLYFQFLTQNQTTETALLMESVTTFTDGQPLKGRVKLYAQGAISHSSFTEIGALVSRMAKRRFNELELTPDVSWLRLGGGQSHIKFVECTLSVSPTCALWFPAGEWKTDGDRASDNRYRTAKSHEDALVFHRISREPSVFCLLLVLATNLTKDALLDECANRLAKTLPESLDRLRIFGCCDVVEPIFIPQLKKSVVMPQIFQVMRKVKPPAYPELGERFESLHPLMFGSRRLCTGISDALGKEAKLVTANRARDFAVVRSAPTCNEESAKKRVVDWLITGTDKLT